MELELGLEPNEGSRLLRLPLLAPARRAAPRSRPVKIVWHDSPDHALVQAGMVVASQAGQWRLERILADHGAPLPGAPAATLATGPDPQSLGHQLPDPLVPMAAFDGRTRRYSLTDEHGTVVMTVMSGTLRSVATEHSVMRIRLAGAPQAVQNVAVALAKGSAIAVAPVPLSAEALERCAGVQLPEPPSAPDLPTGLSVAAAFAHLVGYLHAFILRHAPSARTQPSDPEPVHQMRVAVRRLRSGIKVFRSAVPDASIDAVDRDLKSLAARLAPARDWDVFVTETCAAVAAAFPADKRLQRLIAAAERRRRACHEELSAYLAGAEFRRLAIELACLSASGLAPEPVPEAGADDAVVEPLPAFAARMLNKRVKRLLSADAEVTELEPAALHAIRLRAKRLRYAAEMFSPLYGKQARRYIQTLSRLQDRLGALNDGAVAASLLAELGANGGHAFAAGLVLGFIGAQGQHRRERIDKSWRKFHHAAMFWE